MVNVGGKAVTRRTAHAVAIVTLPGELAGLLGRRNRDEEDPNFPDGDSRGRDERQETANSSLCHLHSMTARSGSPDVAGGKIAIHCRVQTHAKTGVEMEAMTVRRWLR